MTGAEPGEQIGLPAALNEIYLRLSRPRRRQFYYLLGLMLVGAFAELATIGSVVPFLALLADSGGEQRFPWPLREFDTMGGLDPVIIAALVFSAFAILSGFVRLQLVWATQDFGYRLGHDLIVDIQRRILLQPYSFHIERNTSSLLTAVEKVEVLVFDVLLPLMQALIAAFLSVFIIAALIYIDPFTALVATAAFSIIYLLVSAAARKRLASNSQVIGRCFDERMKIAQESLGGIRDAIIDNSQSMYLELFERVDRKLSLARANTAFIASAPRFIIETLGIVILAVVALALARREGGLSAAIPVLGAVALGAQRLLPLLQQIYTGWSTASGQRAILAQIVDLLHLPVREGPARAKAIAPLPFAKQISFDGVSFAYPTRRARAVDEVSLEIPCGTTVALVGDTGSGKSTLADLLMGLLEPSEGRILIDGEVLAGETSRRWQRGIAHVPQSIFLADASIAANIALGVPVDAVDFPQVVEASKKAQLHEFVTSLPDSYETHVGERGVRLSGGQRQRLGIARAIYKQAPVLVLDEATNALDEPMEAKVIDALHELAEEGRTIMIIAHRASTIARCDMVVRLHKGRLVKLGSLSSARTGHSATP